MSSSRSGFTVFEMLIVMIVFGVIATVTGPKLAQSLRAWRTRTAADRFVRAHELARATAARFGRVAELHIDPSAKRFWVEVDTSGTGVRDTIGPLQDFADGKVTIASDHTLLCFDSRGLRGTRGTCQSGSAIVVFSMPGRADTVQITSLGKVLR